MVGLLLFEALAQDLILSGADLLGKGLPPGRGGGVKAHLQNRVSAALSSLGKARPFKLALRVDVRVSDSYVEDTFSKMISIDWKACLQYKYNLKSLSEAASILHVCCELKLSSQMSLSTCQVKALGVHKLAPIKCYLRDYFSNQ